MILLLRLAPEIAIKSKQVKRKFETRLLHNIKAALACHSISATVEGTYGRMFVKTDDKSCIEILTKIFGISSISPVDSVCEPTMPAMLNQVSKYSDNVKDKTFAVRAQRSNVAGFTSLDIERELGSVLYPHSKCVNLTNPDVLINVDVRPEGAFFYLNKFECAEGLPLGTQGRALCLISGGFDSAIAAWKLMKRGVELDFLFCNLAGSSYERSVVAVTKELCSNWSYGYNPTLYVVDFENIVSAIKENIEVSYSQVILKRAFYKVANIIANKFKYSALITGESVGQVSSQTLQNLTVIDEASPIVVHRPLIGEDKKDIISLSRRLSLFNFSAHVKEYCNLVEKHPITNASLTKTQFEESKIPPHIYNTCASKLKTIDITTLDIETCFNNYYFTTNIPDNAIVIDCRSKEQYDSWHYPNAQHIEFYELAKSYKRMDKSPTYIIYCPYGLKSTVIAEKMQSDGYEAYSYKNGLKALRERKKGEG